MSRRAPEELVDVDAPEQKVAWSPQAGRDGKPGTQELLVTCPIADIFFGGARGGGKTDGLLGDFSIHAGTYGEHAVGYLFRRTLDDFDELVRRSKQIFIPMGWTFNHNDNVWTAPTLPGQAVGATLTFRYLERPEDAERYLGFQMTWLGIDQAELFPDPTPIDRLWGSLRSPHGVPCVRRMTGNPPAPAWLFQRYIERHPDGLHPFTYQPLPEEAPELTIEAIFIPSKLEDNALLVTNDPEYEARLAASGGPELFKAWRYGRWDVMVGAVFKEWRRQLHIVAPDFRVPRGWVWAAGLDWGYRAPFWFGWFASGPDGDVVCVDEVYARGISAFEAGYGVGLTARQYPRLEYIAADEQMWNETGTSAPTIAEEFQAGFLKAYGGDLEECPKLIEAAHGPGSRLTKLQLMHRYLEWRQVPRPPGPLPAAWVELEAGKAVPPWSRPLLRFHPRCEAAIRTIPPLKYNPTQATTTAKRKEDVDTSLEDHPYDGASCYLMSRPPLAERAPAVGEPDRHPGFEPKGRKRAKPQWERAARAFWEQQRSGKTAAEQYRVARQDELVPLDER